MEDKLQSRCSRIGPRNTLWRPTKMSSPTVNCPRPSEREQKNLNYHIVHPPGSRRLVARQAEATQIQAEPRRGGRRTAGNWAGRPRRAAAATGHRGERQAARRPVPSAQRQGGHGHGARARARHAAPGAAASAPSAAGAAPEPARQACQHGCAGTCAQAPSGRGGAR